MMRLLLKKLQNAMSSFQNEGRQQIYCCVTGTVKSAGTIVALSSNSLYMDNYSRLSKINKNWNILLKKSQQYIRASIIKKRSLLNLFSYNPNTYVIKELGIPELSKYNMDIRYMTTYYYCLFDMLKDLKFCFRK